jgi:hypothetical protein
VVDEVENVTRNNRRQKKFRKMILQVIDVQRFEKFTTHFLTYVRQIVSRLKQSPKTANRDGIKDNLESSQIKFCGDLSPHKGVQTPSSMVWPNKKELWWNIYRFGV